MTDEFKGHTTKLFFAFEEKPMTEERLEVKLKRITDKCEQYWNGPRVDAPELHAILGFIHQEASGVVSAHASDLARMRRAMEFYASPANWNTVWVDDVLSMKADVDADKGEIARKALGPAEQAGEVELLRELEDWIRKKIGESNWHTMGEREILAKLDALRRK